MTAVLLNVGGGATVIRPGKLPCILNITYTEVMYVMTLCPETVAPANSNTIGQSPRSSARLYIFM